jgi:Mlc titration factor MtfA (ptsG expression regulator)
MLRSLRRWQRRRRLSRLDTSPQAWANAWSGLRVLAGLDAAQAGKLRGLAALFLAEKSFEPVSGFTPPPEAARVIALLACVPVLHLGFEWLDDFTTVVLYPDSFVTEYDEHDEETGVVHRVREARAGESWDIGPLVLSWIDITESLEPDGFNVVIHEIAHKLDALDGAVNGKPPLHRGMAVADWSKAFLAAFEDHLDRVEQGRPTVIDPYAAEAPEEFFAVASEAFFETPDILLAGYPDVYRQLRAFYRQDPVRRTNGSRSPAAASPCQFA